VVIMTDGMITAKHGTLSFKIGFDCIVHTASLDHDFKHNSQFISLECNIRGILQTLTEEKLIRGGSQQHSR
jgi:hypothetical protein